MDQLAATANAKLEASDPLALAAVGLQWAEQPAPSLEDNELRLENAALAEALRHGTTAFSADALALLGLPRDLGRSHYIRVEMAAPSAGTAPASASPTDAPREGEGEGVAARPGKARYFRPTGAEHFLVKPLREMHARYLADSKPRRWEPRAGYAL